MDLPDNNRGFWLVPEWQGQGLMSEASDAVTRYWFEELDKEVLRAPKAAVNTRSVNFSQRSGMRLVRREKAHYVAGELNFHDVFCGGNHRRFIRVKINIVHLFLLSDN